MLIWGIKGKIWGHILVIGLPVLLFFLTLLSADRKLGDFTKFRTFSEALECHKAHPVSRSHPKVTKSDCVHL